MRASIMTNTDESVHMRLDIEAAKAVFASILFAAQFHEGITPLVEIARLGLRLNDPKLTRRPKLCR